MQAVVPVHGVVLHTREHVEHLHRWFECCLEPWNILRVVVLTQYRHVKDNRTDRQTDGNAIASTALAMRALRQALRHTVKTSSLFAINVML